MEKDQTLKQHDSAHAMPRVPTKINVPKTAALGTDFKSVGVSNGKPILSFEPGSL